MCGSCCASCVEGRLLSLMVSKIEDNCINQIKEYLNWPFTDIIVSIN